MKERFEKGWTWVKEHKRKLIGAGLMIGGGFLAVKGIKVLKTPVIKDAIETVNKTVDPWVELKPATWNAGKLHSLQWSKEDALICIEDLTADKLGVLGEDLLTCAMKEDEPVDVLLHIFYRNTSQE